MSAHKSDYYVIPAQLTCFSISFILVFVIQFVHYGDMFEILIKMNDTFFMTGTTLLSIKLARDGWEMPAAGLIILAIG